MNKMCINSVAFLRSLRKVNERLADEFIIIKTTKDCLYFADMELGCYSNGFSVPLYRSTIKKLIKILELLNEQPITLQFEDTELFNVKICEAFV